MHPRATQFPGKRTPKNVRSGARQGWAWCLAPERRQGNPQLPKPRGGRAREKNTQSFVPLSTPPQAAKLLRKASPDKKAMKVGGRKKDGGLGSEGGRAHTWQGGLLAGEELGITEFTGNA